MDDLLLRVEENLGILIVFVADVSSYSSCPNFVKTEVLQIHVSRFSQEFIPENSVKFLLASILLQSNTFSMIPRWTVLGFLINAFERPVCPPDVMISKGIRRS
jgi:hypothetical protein